MVERLGPALGGCTTASLLLRVLAPVVAPPKRVLAPSALNPPCALLLLLRVRMPAPRAAPHAGSSDAQACAPLMHALSAEGRARPPAAGRRRWRRITVTVLARSSTGHGSPRVNVHACLQRRKMEMRKTARAPAHTHGAADMAPVVSASRPAGGGHGRLRAPGNTSPPTKGRRQATRGDAATSAPRARPPPQPPPPPPPPPPSRYSPV
jgi:hypothetical protein